MNKDRPYIGSCFGFTWILELLTVSEKSRMATLSWVTTVLKMQYPKRSGGE